MAVNDQFAPAAAFLGAAHVDLNPAHVTYVVDGARDRPSLGIVGNHAYWTSGLTLRGTSHTGGNGDRTASSTPSRTGSASAIRPHRASRFPASAV